MGRPFKRDERQAVVDDVPTVERERVRGRFIPRDPVPSCPVTSVTCTPDPHRVGYKGVATTSKFGQGVEGVGTVSSRGGRRRRPGGGGGAPGGGGGAPGRSCRGKRRNRRKGTTEVLVCTNTYTHGHAYRHAQTHGGHTYKRVHSDTRTQTPSVHLQTQTRIQG